MEKISCIDRVRHEVVLRRDQEERIIVHTVKRRKANWIGHIWRRNCLLKQSVKGNIEGSIEVTGRRGRRGKQLLYGIKENTGHCTLNEEALDRTVWRNGCVRGCGPVVRLRNE
jgi:hypothetical protein